MKKIYSVFINKYDDKILYYSAVTPTDVHTNISKYSMNRIFALAQKYHAITYNKIGNTFVSFHIWFDTDLM